MEAATSTHRPKKKTSVWVWIILPLCIAITAVFLYWWYPSSSDEHASRRDDTITPIDTPKTTHRDQRKISPPVAEKKRAVSHTSKKRLAPVVAKKAVTPQWTNRFRILFLREIPPPVVEKKRTTPRASEVEKEVHPPTATLRTTPREKLRIASAPIVPTEKRDTIPTPVAREAKKKSPWLPMDN